MLVMILEYVVGVDWKGAARQAMSSESRVLRVNAVLSSFLTTVDEGVSPRFFSALCVKFLFLRVSIP